MIVAGAAAAAALATSSTAAETWPSGGASLTAGGSQTQADPAGSAAPLGGIVPTGAAPLTGGAAPSATTTIGPAVPAPTFAKFSGSTTPSGGVALLPLAHIAARLAPPHSDGAHKTWTLRVGGRQLTFNQLSPR